MAVEDFVVLNVKSGAGCFGHLMNGLSSWRLIGASLLGVLFILAVSTNAQAADATIEFQDNANNETTFIIERNLNGGSYVVLQTVSASPGTGLTVSVLDTTLVASATTANKYCYRVAASNSAGNSAYASTATPGVTDCKVIAQLVSIPVPASGLLVK